MLDERPEQIGDYMESITGSLVPAAISAWLQKVAERAKELCPDSGVEFVPGGDFGEISIPTKEGARCVIDSLKHHEKDAPDLVKAILAAYRARLERQA
ncbi:MAG: hypothetical protein QXJ74_01945 [Nitrososphaera sp.]|uniref:hypothetical protein n=1 Tax=Nitrososphaera sp. TaxID=1971748 RepID=UPI0017A67177|nr:hypothetical protein [Nitrososphaera sp.]NWG38312.1 hypothetical protein [Nitrososphaera sp.]